MVVFLTGVMGAGKSYEAICRLYAYFGNDKKTKTYLKSKYIINKDIKHLRTNIPYNKESFTIDEEIDTSFKYEKFYEKIQMLHAYYLDDNFTEEDLLEKAKEYGIADTFFIIDECHNYLDKADKALLFFFTYHRHFHCEVLLITQNLSLVNYKYKGFVEQFVRAVPSTFQLVSRNFVYKYFPNSRMAAKDLYKTDKIKKLDTVFKAYTSGGKVFTNNAVKKILISSIILLVLVITSFYFVINTFLSDNKEEIKTVEEQQTNYKNENSQIYTNANNQIEQTQLNKTTNEPLFELEDSDGFILISFICNKKECFNDDYSMSSELLSVLSKKKIVKVIDYQNLTKSSYHITLVTTPSFVNLYEYKGVNDEKDIAIGTDTKYSYSSN